MPLFVVLVFLGGYYCCVGIALIVLSFVILCLLFWVVGVVLFGAGCVRCYLRLLCFMVKLTYSVVAWV